MKRYDEIRAAAADRPPFSNGEIGYAWQTENCECCLHDALYRVGGSTEGCPILRVALSGRTPAEWTEGNSNRIQDYTCSEFEAVTE